MMLPPQPGRRKAAVASSSNAPRPGEARYLCCGGLDAGCTCASPLCRLEGGPRNSQNVPRVCLLAVHDTCTMPISRARPVVRECRCSVEAAHVRSDETLLGTRTRDGGCAVRASARTQSTVSCICEHDVSVCRREASVGPRRPVININANEMQNICVHVPGQH